MGPNGGIQIEFDIGAKRKRTATKRWLFAEEIETLFDVHMLWVVLQLNTVKASPSPPPLLSSSSLSRCWLMG